MHGHATAAHSPHSDTMHPDARDGILRYANRPPSSRHLILARISRSFARFCARALIVFSSCRVLYMTVKPVQYLRPGLGSASSDGCGVACATRCAAVSRRQPPHRDSRRHTTTRTRVIFFLRLRLDAVDAVDRLLARRDTLARTGDGADLTRVNLCTCFCFLQIFRFRSASAFAWRSNQRFRRGLWRGCGHVGANVSAAQPHTAARSFRGGATQVARVWLVPRVSQAHPPPSSTSTRRHPGPGCPSRTSHRPGGSSWALFRPQRHGQQGGNVLTHASASTPPLQRDATYTSPAAVHATGWCGCGTSASTSTPASPGTSWPAACPRSSVASGVASPASEAPLGSRPAPVRYRSRTAGSRQAGV